jgi:Concanavalin A-like lectin/glucanases superfamily
LIAKLVFLILVLIGFMIFMYLGIALVVYFTSSANNPYLITGLNDGTNSKIIPQDPKNPQSITILRSNNRSTGIECTWSVWLKMTDVNPKYIYSHIFSKGGNGVYDSNGVMQVNNAPGVYFVKCVAGTNNPAPPGSPGPFQINIKVYMNTASSNPTSDIETATDSVIISGVPIGKWFNLMVRLENKVMDVYMNGTLTQRHIFTNVPIQNYDDVHVCGNGGFTGNLSDLRYFNRSLNVFEINNIVAAGPNLSYASGNQNSTSKLSYLWYNSNANV